MREYDWYGLTAAERREHPEGHRLWDIENELDAITGKSLQILERLPRVRAASLAGAIAKVQVAVVSILPEDYPYAHPVLKSAMRDLKAIGKAAR